MGKKTSKTRSDGFVYSTGPSPIDWSKSSGDSKSASGPHEAVLRIEKKGRGGKAVTVIELRGTSEDQARELGKKLKNACGVGGTTKGTIIEIQGDQRERLRELLASDGYRVRG